MGKRAYCAQPMRFSQSLADAAVADDRQRVLVVEPGADAINFERLGIHLAAFEEEHGRRVAGAAGPHLAERRVDELPLLGGFRLHVFRFARHRQKSAGGLAVRRSSLIKGRGTTFAFFISFWYCNSRMA